MDTNNIAFLAKLIIEFDGANESRREEIVEELSRSNSELARMGIRAASADSSTLVRNVAAEALGIVGTESDLYRLHSILQSDTEMIVRASAAESIGMLGFDSSIQCLEDVLLLEDDSIVRGYIALSLAKLNASSSVPLLTYFANNRDQDQGLSGILFALYKLDDKEHLSKLLSLLDSNSTDVHLFTLAGLADGLNDEMFTEADQRTVMQAVRRLSESDLHPEVALRCARILDFDRS